MSNRIIELEVELLDPIKIGKDGHEEVCNAILLRCPSRKNAREAAKLKSAYHQAANKEVDVANLSPEQIQELQKVAEKVKTEKKKANPSEPINTIAAFGELDKCLELLDALLCNGCGEAIGQKITNNILNKLSYEDYENLLGNFLVSFLLNSQTS